MIRVPSVFNYIALFLTFRCCYRCSYCINRFSGLQVPEDELSGDQWVRFLNHLDTDVPVTLQGGEPSLHAGFYRILSATSERIKLDILTNLSFDVKEFIARVAPARLNREAPYAPIRVSYHPETMDLDQTIHKVRELMNAGFRVGMYGVLHPAWKETIERAMERCLRIGIDFRTKEFLGYYNGKCYGKYKYPQAMDQVRLQKVRCRTTELILGPQGNVYRCHTDIYTGKPPVGNITDENLVIKDIFRECTYCGMCNPCDIKVKNNRFQQFGHTSVQIEFPGAEDSVQRVGDSG
jgi:MoaA/NifB/PqqE/SkfB family radical SAM enzyme